VGDADAKDQLSVLLPAVRHDRQPGAGLRLTRGNSPRWLLWTFVTIAAAGFAVMVPISVAPVETSMATYLRLMIFRSWI
jgi:hypothetical protein